MHDKTLSPSSDTTIEDTAAPKADALDKTAVLVVVESAGTGSVLVALAISCESTFVVHMSLNGDARKLYLLKDQCHGEQEDWFFEVAHFEFSQFIYYK